jgi:lipopolysaccharide export system permease protein
MRTLGWLLSKMLLLRFAMILFGIVIFVLTLDMFTYSDKIVTIKEGLFESVGSYALMRTPELINRFMVIAVLLATLLTLSDVSRHSELVAIWNAGVSQLRIIFLLMPMAIGLGLVHFLIADQATPRAAPVLHEWAIGDYSNKKLQINGDDPLWMQSGRDILRAGRGNVDTTHLQDIIIFKRDRQGILTEQIMAAQADLINGRWVLRDAVIYYRSEQPPDRVASLVYSGAMRPAITGSRSGDPEEMSLVGLSYFIKNAGFGIRPKHVYSTWLNKRIAGFFSIALMILIAVPLAHRFRRGGGLGVLFMLGVAAGFAYFIFDGIALTMGELGLLPPWLAAWAPMVAFTAASGTMMVRQETL